MAERWFRRLAEVPGIGYIPELPINRSTLWGHDATPETLRYRSDGQRLEALQWPARGALSTSATPAKQWQSEPQPGESLAHAALRQMCEALELPGTIPDYHFAIASCSGMLWQQRHNEPWALLTLERLAGSTSGYARHARMILPSTTSRVGSAIPLWGTANSSRCTARKVIWSRRSPSHAARKGMARGMSPLSSISHPRYPRLRRHSCLKYDSKVPLHEVLSAESFLEYAFVRWVLAPAVDAAISPRVLPQHDVPISGRTYRIDYGILGAELQLAVELDGYAYHGDRVAFSYDRLRQNDLQAAGWTVLRFTYDTMRRDTTRCVAQLQAMLASDSLLKAHIIPNPQVEEPEIDPIRSAASRRPDGRHRCP